MNRQYIIIAVVIAAVLLLAGAGTLIYGVSQGGNVPGLTAATPTPLPQPTWAAPSKVEVTLPETFDELADKIRADYPELANLLENPELGSVYKDFYLAYKEGGEAAARALAHQRGILNDQDQVVMTLVLDTTDTAPLIKELEAEGVIITGSYADRVNIAIPLKVIEDQVKAEQPDLIVNRISNLEHVIRLELPRKAKVKEEGVIEGQGVNVTLANKWQAEGFTGKGVKVGVLDLGFAGYKQLLGRELPDQVTLEAFGDTTMLDQEVHGTACTEIIHEMAPDAEIVLAYYDGSEVAMAQAIEWLISQDVDIISNSTGSNGLTPMDGTGFAQELVDKAYDAGVFWVNAAGNEADVHYRGQFTDTNGDGLHEYFPDVQVLPFIPYANGMQTEIIISWDDWQAVDQDYDVVLLDKDGNLLATSEEPQDGQQGQSPIEGFIYEFEDNEIYLLAIQNYENNARGDATFDIFIHGGAMHPDFVVPEHSLGSPSDARGAFAIAAVNWADDVLEPYSSQGPTADGRIKPDLAAPSVVDSASYAPEAFNGTSAAAPHVSGAAALVLQAHPDFTPADLAQFLQERSKDLGPAGPDNEFGAGRLNLGESATDGEVPVEATAVTPPTAVTQLRSTSTPRPPEPTPAVGLPVQAPVQPVAGGQPGQGAIAAEEDSSLAVIVWAGVCMMCMAGLVFFVVVIGAVVLMRRRK